MTSSKRQREIARRRAERQAARRAERLARRRKRNLMVGGVFAAVLLLVGGGFLVANLFEDEDTINPLASPSESAEPGDGGGVACDGEELKAPAKPQEFGKEPPLTIDKTKKYRAAITTSCGVIEADLFADKAPKTVNSFAFLAGKNFFDNTSCHRATTSPTLTVLQCGDPTATGSGGPGYKFADENLKGATYPRGTLAMANSGKGTNGSQFFLVAKDSQLPPSYTVWGKITPAGLTVLDKIMANGVEGGGTDGPPAKQVFLADFVVKPV
ncbi:MAG TPA: peptidylprolyl isomerase [Mycobacteriales bacterium]|nr:peptidylprolyl isomerase [Mycobacteriales bacterium]